MTDEEAELVDRYTADGLGHALIEAHNALLTANSGNRAEFAEADRRYLLLLNLIAKLDPLPDPSPPEMVERQQAYLAALPAEQALLAGLPADERTRRLAEFKATFFEHLDTKP